MPQPSLLSCPVATVREAEDPTQGWESESRPAGLRTSLGSRGSEKGWDPEAKGLLLRGCEGHVPQGRVQAAAWLPGHSALGAPQWKSQDKGAGEGVSPA